MATKKPKPKMASGKDQPKITKHMLLADVVQRYPSTIDVFIRYGLRCFGCHVAAFETIEQGALAHGIPVDELVKALNRSVSTKR